MGQVKSSECLDVTYLRVSMGVVNTVHLLWGGKWCELRTFASAPMTEIEQSWFAQSNFKAHLMVDLIKKVGFVEEYILHHKR